MNSSVLVLERIAAPLGIDPSCKRHQRTEHMVEVAVSYQGIEATVEKITDRAKMAKSGIASIPGIVIAAKMVHASGLPTDDKFKRWLYA